jgi:beta-galactosidase
MRATPTAIGLDVAGEAISLISGEVHYWRLDPARWAAVLDAVAGLGFGCISTYVPWARHEIEPGRIDTTGALDIAAFLGLAHERGLRAVVRIGPDTASEQEDSGWPRRLLDDPACQARRPNGLPYVLLSSTGHCFPPSYASTVFLAEAERWFAAIGAVLAPLLAPDGPVVAVQIDNEMGYHFQGNTYALDHHPDAVAQYRTFVGDPGAEPPRDADDQTEADRLAWVEFREHHLRESLRTLAGFARRAGLGEVPLVHNDYPRTASPIDTGALEASGAVDIAGADVYAPRQGAGFVRDLCRRLTGSTRLPYLAELGAGWLTLPWLLPMAVSAADEEAIALRVLTSGVRATNVYMLVERDRWWGSPISADGEVRPGASLYPRLFALLARAGLERMERQVEVLLVDNRTEGRRVAARDTLGGIVPSFTQLLPIDHRLAQLPHPDTDELARWERGLADAVAAAGADVDRATSDALPDLTRYTTVLVPMLDAFEPAAWQRLTEAAASGVAVGVGPRWPSLDGRARSIDPEVFEDRNVLVLEDPTDAAALVPAPAFRADRTDVVLTLWRGDGRTVLVAAHDGDETVPVAITGADPGGRFVGLWQAETLTAGDDGTVRARLGPWAVQVWEVSG